MCRRTKALPEKQVHKAFLHIIVHQCTRGDSEQNQYGSKWTKSDNESPNKPFIKKDKPKDPFKPNIPKINEKRKCHKCGGIGHLANNFLKKAKINEIVEKEEHNDEEDELDIKKTLKSPRLLEVMKLI
ncbi:hypothetical protein O181_038766 [Austropuccinia psidii MF-1]|uniref:CCHC-type domain-containing protein n=1 Tax=Austropuccinia psidii MF-1 TaxID=1389203 RepID=A0A9Q3D8J3_9BASI|nr:hypothetical protein [Austropuccinia psidii MF-1]